jgi:hypothetical protein
VDVQLGRIGRFEISVDDEAEAVRSSECLLDLRWSLLEDRKKVWPSRHKGLDVHSVWHFVSAQHLG